MSKVPHVAPSPRRVSIVALPDAAVSTLFGIFDVMKASAFMDLSTVRPVAPFEVDIVGESAGPMELASGVPIDVQRAIGSIETTDMVILPSVGLGGWGCARVAYLR